MLERAPDEADVRAVAAFLVHLNALFCVGELTLREPAAKSPLISTVLAAEAAGQRPRGLATLFALPGALAQVDARLATPPGIDLSLAVLDRFLDRVFSLADVAHSATAQALGPVVVFFLLDVASRLQQKVHRVT